MKNMLIRYFALAAILFQWLFGSWAYALPKSIPTSLPIDNRMVTQENREMLEFIGSLTVYADYPDPHLFYYVPMFRVVSEENRKAVHLIIYHNRVHLKNQLGYELERKWGSEVRIDLYKAIEDGEFDKRTIDRVVDTWGLKIEKKEMAKHIAHLSGQLDSSKRRIASLLKSLEISYPSRDFFDLDDQNRSEILANMSKSTGGFLLIETYATLERKALVETYATLERKALDFIDQYHQLRRSLGLPPIRVVELPFEKIDFVPLVEAVATTEIVGIPEFVGIPVFRILNGGGSIRSATIYAELTLDGAAKFLSSQPPFILPVSARGVVKFLLPGRKIDHLIIDIPTRLCIAYNPEMKKYVACREEETETVEEETVEKDPITLDGFGFPDEL